MIGIMTAAGKGTRMKALTGIDLPKVLLPINKKPVIAYGIESMKSMGIDNIYIIALEQYEDDFLKLNEKYNNLHFLFIKNSDHVMDSLDKLAKFVVTHKTYNGENAVYWLADNIFIGESYKIAISRINKKMFENTEIAQTGLLLVETDSPKDFITMNQDGSFVDKPQNPETNISATGVFIVNNVALKSTSERVMNSSAKEFTIWDSWMKNHKLLAEKIDDAWIDVGTPERYLEIKRSLEMKK